MRKQSSSYIMVVNSQQLLLQRSNHEMPLLAHPFKKKNWENLIAAHPIRSNTTQAFPMISDNTYCNFWIASVSRY